jgi:hypothetical protein
METATKTGLKSATNGNARVFAGLTKREYFAAMAMQGMLASEGEDHGFLDTHEPKRDENGNRILDELGEEVWVVEKTAAQQYAEAAVERADALIEALNKKIQLSKTQT